MNILGTTLHQTKKGNYIFLAKKSGKEYSVYGYDGHKQKFVKANDLPAQKDPQRKSGRMELGLKNDFLQLTYFE
jgi:hypothetical protein